MIYYTFCDELWRYHYTFCKELHDLIARRSSPHSSLYYHFLCSRLAGSCAALASSAHSLQEMMMQMKDKRHPLCAKGYLILYMGG